MRSKITIGELLDVLHYDPRTGNFTWLVKRGPRAVGSRAGGLNGGGQLLICFKGRYYTAARLAYLYMMGEWPPAEIDHINRDPTDNRWENLRPANRSENCTNRRTFSTTGFKGVSFHKYGYKKKYTARIVANGKLKSLGYFETPEQAHAAYVAAALKYHGQFAYLE